ncbi:MAG: PAS domain-containing protein [Planctomycetota bacterium]
MSALRKPEPFEGELVSRVCGLLRVALSEEFAEDNRLSQSDLSAALLQAEATTVRRLREGAALVPLATILDLIPVMVAYVDSTARLTYANTAYAKKYNAAPAALIGRSVQDVTGRLYPQIKDNVLAALSGVAQVFDVQAPGPEEGRWMEARYLPDSTSDGDVLGFVVVIGDVQEERELKLQNDRLRYAVDQGMEGFALHDESGNFTFVNQAQASMYGYEVSELLGCHWSLFYSKQQVAEIERDHFPVLVRSGRWRGELVGRRKDGTSFEVEVSLTLLVGDAEEPVGIACNCRDVTDRKHAEECLRQLQRIDALGQLTGGIAHDFNNLLSVIVGNLELLRSDPTTGPGSIEGALEAAQRGASLTNQLLSFARKQSLDPVPIELSALVARMQDMLSRTLGDGVKVEVDLSANLWRCLADRTQLESALLNLALNARDAMPDGGAVTIGAENTTASDAGTNRSGEFVCLSVCDTGVGMDRVTLQRIFDPFFTTKAVGQGTGLGLSMVHGFASQSGGFVRAFSELGVGSTFKLFLPRSTNEVETTDDSEACVGDGNGLVIALVEDDASVRRATTQMLEEIGYRVTAFETAEAASRAIATGERCDLILTDLLLAGGESGLELIDDARSQRPDQSVLLMTGYSEHAVPQGVSVLRKPFTLKRLASAVALALRDDRELALFRRP